MTIYFAGAIRGGRADQALYLQIIELLRRHGTVLTEHIGAAAPTSSVKDYLVIEDVAAILQEAFAVQEKGRG